jgi:hypothetical protein
MIIPPIGPALNDDAGGESKLGRKASKGREAGVFLPRVPPLLHVPFSAPLDPFSLGTGAGEF